LVRTAPLPLVEGAEDACMVMKRMTAYGGNSVAMLAMDRMESNINGGLWQQVQSHACHHQ
jgi:hypothetical protein